MAEDDSTMIATMSAFLSTTIDFCDRSTQSTASGSPEQIRQVKRRLAPNPKEEIEYLHSKQRYLLRELRTLQERQAIVVADKNPWKLRAIAQAQGAHRAMQENERLKEMLQEQLKVIDAMEKVIAKRSKTTEENVQSLLWKQAILTTDHRLKDLEELMQLQYDKLETEWIRHQMYEAMDNSKYVLKTFVESNGDGMILHFVHSSLIPLDFVAMAEIMWGQMTHKSEHSTVLHSFHSDMVYLKHTCHLPDKSMPVLSSRLIYRRWIEGDRVVMAWRTIHEDPLNPHNPNDLIDTRCGWATTHAKSDDECFLSVYAYMDTPDIPTYSESNVPAIGTLTELLLRVSKENGEKFGHRVHQAIMKHKANHFLTIMEPDALDMSILALLNDSISSDDLSDFLADTVDFSTTSAGASLKRKSRPNPKEEIFYLKQKQRELAARLEELKMHKCTENDDESWKARAKQQAQQAQRALQVNTRLKELVEEQIRVVESLERVILKRPKLLVFPTSEGPWKNGILSIDNREADLEALLHLQYERLGTEWIRHDLYQSLERNESMRKVYFDSNGSEAAQLNSVMCRAVPLDFIALADIIWNLMAIDVDPKFERVQEFHPNLVYMRYLLAIPRSSTPTLESRLAVRRWKEKDRIVIISKSIIEDQLYPHNNQHLIENRASWTVVQFKSANECYLSVYMNMSLPIFPSSLQEQQPAVGTLTELMLEMAHTGSEKFGGRVRKAVNALLPPGKNSNLL